MVLLIGLVVLLSCRSDQGRVYWVDEERKVNLAFNAQAETDLSDYILNFIGPDGQRIRSREFNLTSDNLQFVLDNDLILSDDFYTKAEQIVAMGDELPTYPARLKALARIEIRKEYLEGNTGKTAYLQFPLPLLQSDLLAAKQDLRIDANLDLVEVAYQVVKIIDLKTGEPIEDASVIGVVNERVPTDDNTKEEIWRSNLFRPIIHKTDKSGLATLLPLKNITENSNFTVIAYASGYCTYVSPSLKYSQDSIPEIMLRPCDFADETTLGFVANFHQDEFTYTDPVNGEDRLVSYNSGSSVRIRVDSYSPMLTGLKFRLTETHEQDGGEGLGGEVIKISDDLERYNFKFVSELSIDLPILFKYNGTTNGQYILRVLGQDVPLSEDADERLIAHLYGTKNTEVPSIEFASDITIQGPVKEDVLSGKEDAEFYISTKLCTPGVELAVGEVFKPCDENSRATFSISEISLVNKANQIGGKETIKLFLKNRYKLVSKDDHLQRNHFEVFIDYGDPSFDSKTLGKDFGFANKSDAKGSDEFPYIYPIGTLSGGSTNTIIINKNSLSDTVFRFPSSAKCLYNGDAVKDGSNLGDNTGITIAGIRLAATEAGLADTDTVTCTDGDSARDILLESGSISFPNDASSDAEFYLLIEDQAGHQSSPGRFSIPPCPENVTTTEGTAFCWQE